jgi:hypothetical protein
MEKGDADRIIEAFQGLRDSLEALHSLDRSQRQEFHINAGGVGVWIATTCCVAMICCMLIGSIFLTFELSSIHQDNADRKSESARMQSYLSAIYNIAPSLKPKDVTTKKEEK